jgi:hypothetical protein
MCCITTHRLNYRFCQRFKNDLRKDFADDPNLRLGDKLMNLLGDRSALATGLKAPRRRPTRPKYGRLLLYTA